ncbi:hypothetical protein [Burkholderia cepacia]|uniref:hypothetical protein n=1 Tax=Burkholderia cepacia TaxID=292 RepID=UPI00158D5B67|nr:hypothetical protein [Burkholderia cepacia]
MKIVDKVIKVGEVFGSEHPDLRGDLRDRETREHDLEKRVRRRAGGPVQTQSAHYSRPPLQRFLPRHEGV